MEDGKKEIWIICVAREVLEKLYLENIISFVVAGFRFVYTLEEKMMFNIFNHLDESNVTPCSVVLNYACTGKKKINNQTKVKFLFWYKCI